jgi:hypothetical protein
MTRGPRPTGGFPGLPPNDGGEENDGGWWDMIMDLLNGKTE